LCAVAFLAVSFFFARFIFLMKPNVSAMSSTGIKINFLSD
jgi:hypothetical protein